MIYKMLSEEKLSKAGKKNIGIRSFYSNTSYGFEYKKNYIVNCLLQFNKNENQNRKCLCWPNASEFLKRL